MKMRNVFLAIFLTVMMAAVVFAVPGGPEGVSVINSSRRDTFDAGAKQVDAQAGNVTQLEINASVITKRWQGYYGNITGTITLDNAQGNTMYDWTAQDLAVTGEIYAASDTITSWNDIICVNLTGNGTGGPNGINKTQIETLYGMAADDGDSVNATFRRAHNVNVGTLALTDCPATNLYVNNNSQTTDFYESLLTENATGTVVFAADVDQNTIGFNGRPWDFQMIVAENGDVVGVTPYSFYVELA
jgi:hypothetical protein